MKHVMLDLETMGTSPGSAIVAIGAVEFSIYKVGDPFSVSINLQSAVSAGLRIDPGTVVWWMQQSDASRAEVVSGTTALKDALEQFAEWLGQGDVCVWGDGAAFDNVLLSSAYRALRMPQPWHYTKDRCFRTMKEMFPVEKVVSDTPHVAAFDAVAQARQMQVIAAKYKVRIE